MRPDNDLVAAAEQKKLKAIAAAEAQYVRDIEAIRIVGELREQSRAVPSDLPDATSHRQHNLYSPRRPAQAINVWPGLPQAIRNAIAPHEAFRVDDVVSYLNEHFPEKAMKINRVDISRGLWRLKEAKEISVQVEGKGRTPAVYKKESGEIQMNGKH